MEFTDLGIKINKRGGRHQKVLCPECSAQRQKSSQPCLSVDIEDGVWFCHHCGWKGSLKKKETYKPVIKKIELPKIIDNKDLLHTWFKKRGVSDEVVERNGIFLTEQYFPDTNKTEPCIAFVYKIGENIVSIKYRSFRKNFVQSSNGTHIFYKLNDVAMADEAICVEGEMDALAFEEAGFSNAISVPNGALTPAAKSTDRAMSFMDNSVEYLGTVKKFYIATDSDAPGQRLKEELVRRIGRAKCWLVKYPDGCKDANDVLLKFGVEGVRRLITEAEPYPVSGVYSPMDREKEFDNLYEVGFPNGVKVGYPEFDKHFVFFPGKLTVITGVPGHGKSNFLAQLEVLLAARHGWTWGIFSPEDEEFEIHMLRLAEQLVGKPFLPGSKNRMTRPEYEAAKAFIDMHFRYIQPDSEKYTLENIKENARYLVLKYGINGLILDPWNTIEHQYKDEPNEHLYVGRVLNELKYFARELGIHLFIVAHPRKMMKKIFKGKDGSELEFYDVPTAYDISGSSNWFNIADSILCVYREFRDEAVTDRTHVYVQKVKQKYIGKTGKVIFDFDVESQRYSEHFGRDRFDYNLLTGEVNLGQFETPSF